MLQNIFIMRGKMEKKFLKFIYRFRYIYTNRWTDYKSSAFALLFLMLLLNKMAIVLLFGYIFEIYSILNISRGHNVPLVVYAPIPVVLFFGLLSLRKKPQYKSTRINEIRKVLNSVSKKTNRNTIIYITFSILVFLLSILLNVLNRDPNYHTNL